jgi:murein DD-endopeptidase MepM/ murein hydrolase activator NlpD
VDAARSEPSGGERPPGAAAVGTVVSAVAGRTATDVACAPTPVRHVEARATGGGTVEGGRRGRQRRGVGRQGALVALVLSVPAVFVLGPRASGRAGGGGAALEAFPVVGTCAYSDTFGYPWGTRNGRAVRHEGIDIFGKRGAPVVAAIGGRVLRQFSSGVGGNVVVVGAPGGTYAVYSHLHAFADAMRPGVPVRAGDTIGYVGDTGSAAGAGPHLHFELHPGGGAATNPYAALRAVDRGRCSRASMDVVPRRARNAAQAKAKA